MSMHLKVIVEQLDNIFFNVLCIGPRSSCWQSKDQEPEVQRDKVKSFSATKGQGLTCP